MHDRPTISELLDAIYIHLEKQVIPAVEADRRLYYQTLVAMHVLRAVGREIQTGREELKEEWRSLDFVQNLSAALPDDPDEAHEALTERNRKLCDEIKAGRYDYLPQRAALFEHLLLTTRKQLEVSNPKFLEALVLEDGL